MLHRQPTFACNDRLEVAARSAWARSFENLRLFDELIELHRRWMRAREYRYVVLASILDDYDARTGVGCCHLNIATDHLR